MTRLIRIEQTDMTPKTMHRQVELWVIILHRTKKLIHANFRRQLLANLPYERFLWCFPSFHLPAREFPAVLIVAISSLSSKDATLVIVYNRCYNFYLFHIICLQSYE